METYTDLAKKVRDWANRDEEVLSYANIKDFINFGVDNAYRKLRVAPMEAIRSYETDSDDVGDYKLTIPSDLIEIIQLRKRGVNSQSNSNQRRPAWEWEVFEAKADVLSFYDPYIDQYGYNFYTRERNALLVSPVFADQERYEIYYYRRLPEVDARYNVMDTEAENSYMYYALSKDELIQIVKDSEGADVFDADPDLESWIDVDTDGSARLGKLAPNWLRDNNEKVVLYGALMQAGIYLGDEELESRYTERFLAEIETLNMEDNMRRTTGGHIQQRFNSYGLI